MIFERIWIVAFSTTPLTSCSFQGNTGLFSPWKVTLALAGAWLNGPFEGLWAGRSTPSFGSVLEMVFLFSLPPSNLPSSAHVDNDDVGGDTGG